MKTLVILEDDDIEKITKYIEQIDVEIGSLYNQGIPDNIKENIQEINHCTQMLGELLGLWDLDLENR